MNTNMKRFGITLLTAIVGGAVAIGAYKLMEEKTASQSIDEKQKTYFASNPLPAINSSAGEVDFTQAAALVSPGVVHLKTTYNNAPSGGGGQDPFGDMFEDFFGRRGRSGPAMGSGSGVLVTTDGYIMTNNHVVEDADKIDVVLPNKKTYSAKVIGRDPNTDLALVKINANNLPIVKLGNSDDVRIGEWVLAVGYPLSLNSTVTAGIVSAKTRSIGIIGQSQQQRNQDPEAIPVNAAIESFIQTDAVINRGNSGGALVNAKGELIGINAAIASQGGNYEGYGFAIPVNLARKIMDDFLKYGEVKRGYIGIQFTELDTDNAKRLNITEIDGLYVSDVVEGGAAKAAGIKRGDIITKLNGKDILSSAEFQETIGRLSPGDEVKLGVLREGNIKNYNITLKGESGTGAKLAANSASSAELYNKLGAGFAPIDAATKRKFGINSGVKVTSIAKGKLMDYYEIPQGIIITYVNGKPVNNVDDVENALAQGRNNMIAISGISPDGAKFTYTFPTK